MPPHPGSQAFRRGLTIVRRSLRRQVLEELEDGETKGDQGRGGADPRHRRSFVGQACAFHGESSGRVHRLICHRSSSTLSPCGGKPSAVRATQVASVWEDPVADNNRDRSASHDAGPAARRRSGFRDSVGAHGDSGTHGRSAQGRNWRIRSSPSRGRPRPSRLLVVNQSVPSGAATTVRKRPYCPTNSGAGVPSEPSAPTGIWKSR
jgi:hypothetical protein